MDNKVAVLGAGSWGSILANLLVGNGDDVRLWSRDPEQVATLNEWHINPQYMKDFKYSKELKATNDMKEAVDGANYVLIVIPTKGLRQVAGKLNQVLEELDARPLIIHATKGLEQNTYKRPSQMIAEEIALEHREDIVVLSGPSHAEDVALQDMTAVTSGFTPMTT